MPEKSLYETKAGLYDILVAKEDYKENLLPTIDSKCDLDGKSIIEFGAGTGRLSFLLARLAVEVMAFDVSMSMLKVAKEKGDVLGIKNCSFSLADNRNMPIGDNKADLVIEGWSLAQMAVWEIDSWKKELLVALNEMNRITRKDGTIILIETLGTMEENSNPPKKLTPFFDFFEKEMGFAVDWIRTDYKFDSVEQAIDLTTFFFGEDIGLRVKESNSRVVAECTGIWFKTKT